MYIIISQKNLSFPFFRKTKVLLTTDCSFCIDRISDIFPQIHAHMLSRVHYLHHRVPFDETMYSIASQLLYMNMKHDTYRSRYKWGIQFTTIRILLFSAAGATKIHVCNICWDTRTDKISGDCLWQNQSVLCWTRSNRIFYEVSSTNRFLTLLTYFIAQIWSDTTNALCSFHFWYSRSHKSCLNIFETFQEVQLSLALCIFAQTATLTQDLC